MQDRQNVDQPARRGRGLESERREPSVVLVHHSAIHPAIQPTTRCLPLNGRGLLLDDGAGMHDAVHCTSNPCCLTGPSTSLHIRRKYASHYIHVPLCCFNSYLSLTSSLPTLFNGSHVETTVSTAKSTLGIGTAEI